jgi:outer membrane immunogenic protein
MLLGAAALVLATAGLGSAYAKDLEGASPVVAQWAGAYVGIHGGYGQANRNGCFDFTAQVNGWNWNQGDITSCDGAPGPATFDYDQNGGLAGLQVGYNWQSAQNFILGLELSASATGMSGLLNNSPIAGEGKWSGIVTATAKAGVAKGNWMFYAEGGYALANATFEGDLSCDFSMAHSGPVVGGGIGVKLSKNVSLDLKYNHIWLGAAPANCTLYSVTIGSDFYASLGSKIRTQGSIDVVKLGLNFHLGS